MKLMRDLALRFQIAGEVLKFFWKKKLWWLMPFIFVIVALGLITVIGTTSGIGPFIYTLF